MSSHSTRHRRPAEGQSEADSVVTLRYHELTKHSYHSVRRRAYALDWANQPSPYKRYMELERQSLPQAVPADLLPTLELLNHLSQPGSPTPRGPANLAVLSALCHLGYGITAQKVSPGRVYSLRAAPSAGALFPCELYLCLRGVESLADGIYHYAPEDHSLSCLRPGDFLAHLRAAAGDHPVLADADIIFAISAIWWRSGWKYRDRSYRYCLHDTGHLAGNVLLAGKALGYQPAVVYDFVDDEVNHLLGLNSEREAALALVACCSDKPGTALPASLLPLASIAPPYRPLSAQEVSHPLILEAHAATSLADARALAAARSRQPAEPPAPVDRKQPSLSLPDPASVSAPQRLSETIARRRSSRSFACQPIPADVLSALLASTVVGYPSDQAALPPLDVAVIVNDVEGLPPGAYCYDAARHHLVQIRAGNLRTWAAYLSLEQRLCGNAAASIFLLADLERLVAQSGERAYRRAHIEAGVRGEFVYLAGRALGWGCSGIGAFYDDQVAEFLEVKPGAGVIYELVVGLESPDERVVECNT